MGRRGASDVKTQWNTYQLVYPVFEAFPCVKDFPNVSRLFLLVSPSSSWTCYGSSSGIGSERASRNQSR